MKFRIFLALCFCLASFAFSDPPAPYPIILNSQSSDRPPLQFYQANQRTIRVTFRDGTNFVNLTGATPFMTFSTNAYSAALVTSSYSVVSSATGIVDFTFSAQAFNLRGGPFVYEGGVRDSNNVPVVYGQGPLRLNPSPYLTGASPTTFGTNVNWATFTSYLNTALYGPYRAGANISFTTNSDGSLNIVSSGSGDITGVLVGGGLLVVTNSGGPEPLVHLSTAAVVAALSGVYATGTPLYAYTETDPVWVAASTGYYSKTQADSQYVNEGQANSITTVMITNDAVTSAKILNGEILNADISVDAAIVPNKIANTSLVQTTTFGGDVTGTFNNIQIVSGAVGASEITDGATLSEIADDDGSGSGLDADLLDGRNSTTFETNLTFYAEAGEDFGEYPTAYAVDEFATVAMGASCIASGAAAFVAGYNNKASSDHAVVGGGRANTIHNGATYGVIAGGSGHTINTGDYAVISGGLANATKSDYATIAGGRENNIGTIDGVEYGGDNSYSVVGGGYYNHIGSGAAYALIAGGQFHILQGDADYSAILGGYDNTVTGSGIAKYSTIAGGSGNAISDGNYAFVAGGRANSANADYAFAAGRNAQAVHVGSFVWGDSGTNQISSTATNQVVMRTQDMIITGLTSTADFHYKNTLVFATPTNAIAAAKILIGSGADNTFWATPAQAGLATGTPLYVAPSGGDVYTVSNNIYADSTKQEMYSATFHTNGSIGMRGYTIADGNIQMQYKLLVTMGTNVYASTIVGGQASSIGANCSLVAIFSSDSSSISAGKTKSVIMGGESLTINGDYSANVGGHNNDLTGSYGFLGGGLNNDINSGNYNAGVGGRQNVIDAAQDCFIGGGVGNDIISSGDSGIVGGQNNLIENATGLDFIGGGSENRIYGYHSTILGSYNNRIYSDLSQVIGAYSVATGGLHQITLGPGAHSRHSGSVVMSGHSDTPSNTNVVSTTTNQLTASFPGGIQLNANAALTVPVNIGGNFQRHAVRQPEFLGIYTNVTATTIIPYAQGDFYMDVGVTQVFWNYTGTTNGWH